ncbi:hypothetical protein [Halopelagius fulvigenes]|uniref:Major facilitator superfamily (MFS) profile domain-containing protein n=1 Tax=Halopelagius fulvigenes TaxID=1198324 RepID=A0ABD5TWZ6_9EURY
MVGPSMTDEERDEANRLLRAGFVLLVAASGALVAFQSGGGLTFVAAGFVGGLVAGLSLLWFLMRWLREFKPDVNRRPPR